MKPNETYVPFKSFSTVGRDDEQMELVAGRWYLATGTDDVVDSVTGEVLKLPLHVSRNAGWYFSRLGQFNPERPSVTQVEYVAELARGNEGLDVDALISLARLEGFGPYGRAIAYNVFTAALSTAVANGRVEMRKDGARVTMDAIRAGVTKVNCTYHKPAPVARNRDGLFAA